VEFPFLEAASVIDHAFEHMCICLSAFFANLLMQPRNKFPVVRHHFVMFCAGNKSLLEPLVHGRYSSD